MFRSQELQLQRQRQRRQHQTQQRQLKATTWLVILFGCTLLQPLCTHSTPIHAARVEHDRSPCAHDSIAELIRTSPVILKALGAHIFSDDDFNGMGLPLGRVANQLNGYAQQNEISASAALNAAAATTISTTSTSAMQTGHDVEENIATPATLTNGNANAITTTSPEMESILITLTPETIYKGASLLKMSPGSENAAHSNSFFNANAAESATPFDGQLNATLQPAHCFESNLLQLLPTELIVFGKLITTQQQLQLSRPQEPQQLPHYIKGQEDLLHISINGFHRWSPHFENHIWKHLGWDDWSDFTLCSVTCGKGVQQRFRRCLLDNPMVNLNMNVNLNAVNVDSEDVDEDDVTNDDDIRLPEDEQNIVDNDDDDDDGDGDGDDGAAVHSSSDDRSSKVQLTKPNVSEHGQSNSLSITVNVAPTIPPPPATTPAASDSDNNSDSDSVSVSLSLTASVGDELRHLSTVMSLMSENNEHVQVANIVNSLNDDDGDVMRTENIKEPRNEKDKRTRKLHKRRKTAKTLETMFCEGYNIEQRNCNTFECSDDINDLLKFYRRPALFEDAAVSPTSMSESNNVVTAKTDVITPDSFPIPADVASDVSVDGSAMGVSTSGLVNSTPSTTPANMGYIRSWHNSLNFTIMLTLRVKNDSKNTATIFSIRNTTHNLYLDQCQDGLRLYLERDNSTEMLPVKFNLYDYRWHQVAISIQNGDFISIYVDCSWTNSFVVSKRLFTLPLDADAEIGRGFSGELQQLLLLPDNQERHQCSSRRTSINEVKRYIIDTFIGDYGN